MLRSLNVFFAALLLTAASATAGLIQPVSQELFIENENERVDAVGFGDFVDSIEGANQTSEFTSNSIVTEGRVFTNDNIRDTESSLDYTFNIATDFDYSLVGGLRGTFSTANARAQLTFERISPNPATINFIETVGFGPPGPSPDFDFSGNLEPGQYRIYANVTGFNGDPVGGASDGFFRFNFDVVPEPATGILLLAFGTCCIRRRRTHA